MKQSVFQTMVQYAFQVTFALFKIHFIVLEKM